MSDPSSIQSEITGTARRLVQTFPVAPGSTPIAHVIQHLAPPHNLYPLPSTFQLQPNTLLDAATADAEEYLKRAVQAMQGAECPIRSIASPYALPNDVQPSTSIAFPPMLSASSRLLTALNPPIPPPPPSTSAPPAFRAGYYERNIDQQRVDAAIFFDNFIQESTLRRERDMELLSASTDAARYISPSKTPSNPPSEMSVRTTSMMSSPDPLGFAGSNLKRKSLSDLNTSPSKRSTFSLQIPVRPSPPTTPQQPRIGRGGSIQTVTGSFPIVKPSMVDGPYGQLKANEKIGHAGDVNESNDQGGPYTDITYSGASYSNGINAPLEKLQDTLDDIFEAENFLGSEEGDAERANGFFVGTEKESRLQIIVVSKLAREIRATEKKNAGKSIGDVLEVGTLQRLTKLLERSIILMEDVEVIPQEVLLGKRVIAETEEKKGKGKKEKNEVVEEEAWTDEMQRKTERELRKVLEAMVAVMTQFELMITRRFPRLALSEDMINASLRALKKALEDVVYPFVEGSNTERHPSLDQPLKNPTSAKLLTEILQAVSAIFPSVATLLHVQEMSEEIIVPSVFIAIGPFFVEAAAPGTKAKTKEAFGAAPLRAIRLSALSLLRTIYGKREDQRQLIMEEILTSLIKLPDPRKGRGQFKLRNGQSIHTVSALLLHLVQTCSPDVLPSLRKTFDKSNGEEVLIGSPSKDVPKEPIDKPRLMYSTFQKVLVPATESASKSARSIVVYLLNKSGKGGKGTNSNETEYRAVLDNFIADLLTVLHLPEWPAADFVLTLFCRSMLSALEDARSSTDITAAKSISLDHLGAIGARIQQNPVRDSISTPYASLTKIISDQDTETFTRLVEDQKDVLGHLMQTADKDSGAETAATFLAIHWGQDIYQAYKISCSKLEQFPIDERAGSEDYARAASLNTILEHGFEHFWDIPVSKDPFGAPAADENERFQDIMDRISLIQGIRLLKDPLLDHILEASDSTVVTFRTKALRALAQIVAISPELFSQPNVRRTIESRVKDSSPAVRDAAIELVGKYIVHKPELSKQYLPLISERIADTGLSVRKRVVKLLKTLYIQLTQTETRVEIGKKLLSRVMDEDDTVKENAMQVVEELWFSKSVKANLIEVTSRAAVLMAVAGSSPLDEAIKFILKQNEGTQTNFIFQNIQAIFESLIDVLVDPPEDTQVDVIGCIKTIYILASANPSMVSPSKAQMLLPYLKSATTPEDAIISDYLLKTFRLSVKAMPKTATKFAQDLQATLMPMINKPSNMSNNFQQALQELIACFCAVINYQTKEYSKIISVFKACNKLLLNDLKKLKATQKPSNLRNMLMVTFLVSFLCEYSQLDETRKTNPAVASELETISKKPIYEHIYETLLELYHCAPAINFKVAALQCLGYIFRAYPSLMLRQSSFDIMDAISVSDKPQLWATLLRIFQDVLSVQTSTSTEQKAQVANGKVDTKILIGDISGQGFADSGVGSAIVQRYTQRIFDSALSRESGIQRAAMDVMTFTVKQGLCHPISCMPTIVALETSADTSVANRALALHSHLQSKHASLINSRFLECAQAAYEYQAALSKDGVVVGYRGNAPTALISKWWFILKDKRNNRIDFLTALVKAFVVEPEKAALNPVKLFFALFIASNLSALEYKVQEDVYTVLYRLNRALAGSAYQTLQLFERGSSGSNGQSEMLQRTVPQTQYQNIVTTPNSSPSKAAAGFVPPPPPPPLPVPTLELCRASQIIMLAMRLKDYLKELYGISEVSLQKFQPTKKSHDKPALRKGDVDLFDCTLGRLECTEDLVGQRDRFMEAIQNDGTLAEPVDVEMEE